MCLQRHRMRADFGLHHTLDDRSWTLDDLPLLSIRQHLYQNVSRCVSLASIDAKLD